jgi:hypothetical protein
VSPPRRPPCLPLAVPRGLSISSGFWTGGRKAYRKELDQQYHAHLKSLRHPLKHTTDEDELEKIRLQIKAAQSEFKEKAAHIGKMIF